MNAQTGALQLHSFLTHSLSLSPNNSLHRVFDLTKAPPCAALPCVCWLASSFQGMGRGSPLLPCCAVHHLLRPLYLLADVEESTIGRCVAPLSVPPPPPRKPRLAKRRESRLDSPKSGSFHCPRISFLAEFWRIRNASLNDESTTFSDSPSRPEKAALHSHTHTHISLCE